MPKCEVCGKVAIIHLTDVQVGSPVKREHHYCQAHAPQEVRAKLPTAADEVKMVEQMIAQLESRQMEEGKKAEYRKSLEQLADDIRAGRRRFGDAD